MVTVAASIDPGVGYRDTGFPIASAGNPQIIGLGVRLLATS